MELLFKDLTHAGSRLEVYTVLHMTAGSEQKHALKKRGKHFLADKTHKVSPAKNSTSIFFFLKV